MATEAELRALAHRLAAHWWPQLAAGERQLVVERLTGGLINQTFAVRQGGAPVAVLQQLHPIFGAEVNLDIEAVTAHLAARGLVTPRLLRTAAGEAWVLDEGRAWRALSWVPGRCVERVPDVRWAEAGGELVGRFHRAVADLQHDYHFSRGNVHDTPRYFARLRALLDEGATAVVAAASSGAPDSPAAAAAAAEADAAADANAEAAAAAVDLTAAARDLAEQIFAVAAALPPIPATALRHCHGDLKISNLLFTPDAPGDPSDSIRGLCLVDLDTLCRGTIAFELGDAMRSWCNPGGEDQSAATFDLELFAAAMRGFRGVADPLLTDDERGSIVSGLATVCVELSARFCIDAFEDRYFGWSAARHPSRRHHNLVRARSQLSLARSVLAQQDDAFAIVRGS